MVTADNWEFYQQLQNWLNELRSFKDQLYGGEASHDELETLRSRLVRTAPKFKSRVESLVGKQYGELLGQEFDIWDEALSEYVLYDIVSLRNRWALSQLIDIVNGALGKLEAGESVESRPMAAARQVQAPKAFIAHGGESTCLRKLCDFLEALGIEPVVAEWNASEGRWTEEHVDKRMEDSDCDIILAEYGGIMNVRTGAKHPRLNVIDELARSRRMRPSRTILLLQKGVDLPSNTSGIVYERFTKQNMEKAFIKVAKELRAFELIRAIKLSG